MKHQVIIRLVGGMLLLSVVLTAFWSSQKRVEASIDYAFKEAIEKDYQFRKSYHYNKSNAIENFVQTPEYDRKIKSYTVKSRTGITTYQFKDSIPEETAKRLMNQYILKDRRPIYPHTLKRYFQDILQKKGIEANVGVLLIQDSLRHWSAADSIVPKGAYSTPRQVLDITGKLKAQAWADYSTGTLVRHLDPVIYVFLLLLIGIWMYIRPGRKQPDESGESPSQETEKAEKGILIDLEKQTLHIDGTECNIPKLDLALLMMLHQRNGECVTREEIKQQFWSTDNNAGEKIDTHVKTIRKILKDFPDYQVMTVRGKGYYLYEERNDKE